MEGKRLSGAAGVSVAVHGIAVLALALFAAGSGSRLEASPFETAAPAAPGVPEMVDVALVDPNPAIEAPGPVAPDLSGARSGDADSPEPASVGPRGDILDQRAAAAPDRGRGEGRMAPVAFRRDDGTARERLADGARIYQPPRSRTSARAGSQQAVRREPRTGRGDAPIDRDEPAGPRLPSDAAPPVPAEGFAVRSPLPPGRGPLEAEPGARSFDVERPARHASDDRSLRAASAERQPALADFSSPAARGPGANGRGPGAWPGATADPSRGAESARPGVPDPASDAAAAAARTRARRYDAYFDELKQRVGAIEFPRDLALRLEQGETVVSFVLEVDGRVRGGVHLQKSSGFRAFDEAAVKAVERAAPFRAIPPEVSTGPLPIVMRIPFQNPLVR